MSSGNNGQGEHNGSSEGSSVQSILNALFTMQSSGAPRSSLGGRPIVRLTGADLLNLLSNRVLSGSAGGDEIVDDDDDEDFPDDEDDDDYGSPSNQGPWFPPVTEPQQAGVELLKSGEFGRVGVKIRSRRQNRNVARSILSPYNRSISRQLPEDIQADLIPNTNGTTVAEYDARMYTAQFSADSSFYYTCAQDFKMHIFDMKAPPTAPSPAQIPGSRRTDPSLIGRMPLRKVIQGHPGRWTITDANLSPDDERLIYASVTPTVYMTSTAPDGNDAQIPINFSDPTSTRRMPYYLQAGSFGIWSCRFSADGNEVVAGGDGKIFVYDLLANRRSVKISAHDDDVNSCCWADSASGNVLVSASDDTFLKVWDRRSMGSSQKPSGVLIGHTEGITYVSAKGDGRYVISNGKDQALRLWDLRKMRTSAEHEAVERHQYGVQFDYRYPPYPRPRYKAHPKDCSVMTYRGHSVLRTLIRCHFSPAETTGGQYIYSGSADGRIHIWSLDGTVAQVLDRSRTLPMSFDPSDSESGPTRGRPRICVRDLSWHSQEPVIMSAGWVNAREGTIIARHEFKGLSKMSGSLEDWSEKQRTEAQETNRRRSSRLQGHARSSGHHGAFFGEEEEEEDDDDYV